MAVTPIKHAFQSAKSDGGDATLVRPSNWNANHKVGSYDFALAPVIIAANNATDAEKVSALVSDGAVCDGTADDVQINAAIASGRRVILSSGTFVMAARLDANVSNFSLEGRGIGITILDFTALVAGTYFINVNGGISAVTANLAANAAAGATSVTVATGEGSEYATGDWLLVSSTEAFNASSQDKGEIVQVSGVAGDVVSFVSPLADSYTTATSAKVEKLTAYSNHEYSGFTILADDESTGINFEYLMHINVHDIEIKICKKAGIRLEGATFVRITNNKIQGCNMAGFGYGVAGGYASRNVLVNGNSFLDCRHAVNFGDDDGTGVSRECVADGNVVSYDSTNTGSGFDTHDGAEGAVFSNNVVVGAALSSIQSKGTILIGNTCRYYYDGHALVQITANADDTLISNNDIRGVGNVSGLIQIDAGSSRTRLIGNHIEGTVYTVVYAQNASKVYLIGNTITGSGDANTVTILGSAAGSQEDIHIRDNELVATSAGRAGLYIVLSSTGNLDNVSITGNNFHDSPQGLHIHGTSTGKIQQVLIANNHFDDAVLAMYIEDLADELLIVGNVVYGETTSIRIDDTVTNYRVLDNRFSADTVIDSVGTGVYRNNAGYVTENSGTGTINSGATTAVITHGLDYTPTAQDIIVTLKENPTNTVGSVWVDTITATQFTVNVESDPGASNLDFGWAVRKV